MKSENDIWKKQKQNKHFMVCGLIIWLSFSVIRVIQYPKTGLSMNGIADWSFQNAVALRFRNLLADYFHPHTEKHIQMCLLLFKLQICRQPENTCHLKSVKNQFRECKWTLAAE